MQFLCFDKAILERKLQVLRMSFRPKDFFYEGLDLVERLWSPVGCIGLP